MASYRFIHTPLREVEDEERGVMKSVYPVGSKVITEANLNFYPSHHHMITGCALQRVEGPLKRPS